MLMCNDTITLIRCNGDSYTTEVISGVSWYDKLQSSMGERQQQPNRSTTIRIPAAVVSSLSMYPERGDLIAHGTATVTSASSLRALDYGRIISVGDNRRGGIPHVVVVIN